MAWFGYIFFGIAFIVGGLLVMYYITNNEDAYNQGALITIGGLLAFIIYLLILILMQLEMLN